VRVVAVDPRSTSQRCSDCGHTERANRTTQAHFCCVVCQFASPADYNAAINISRLGCGHTAYGVQPSG
jgi:transposase